MDFIMKMINIDTKKEIEIRNIFDLRDFCKNKAIVDIEDYKLLDLCERNVIVYWGLCLYAKDIKYRYVMLWDLCESSLTSKLFDISRDI